MINLYTFLSPNGQLDHTHRKMLEVQIENSLDYGNEIMLACNFPFEYKGVKAIEIPSTLINSQYPKNPRAVINSKINIIIYLLENKILTEPAWFHDFDAFQVAPINPEFKDLGVVCYGFYQNWIFSYWGKNKGPLAKEPKMTEFGFPRRVNCGSIFFKPSALDIFKTLLEKMDREGLYEEDALTLLLENNKDIESRVTVMDIGYNIGIRCIRSNVQIAQSLKILHFPPSQPKWFNKFKPMLPPKLKGLLEARFNDKYILITGSKGKIGSNLLAHLKAGAYNVVGITEDVRNKELLRPYFKNASYVVHCAAKLYDATPDEFYSVNVLGTQNVVELCQDYNCKLINLNTTETHGPYGETKQLGAKIVEQAGYLNLNLCPIYSKDMPEKKGRKRYPLERLLNDIVNIIKFK